MTGPVPPISSILAGTITQASFVDGPGMRVIDYAAREVVSGNLDKSVASVCQHDVDQTDGVFHNLRANLRRRMRAMRNQLSPGCIASLVRRRRLARRFMKTPSVCINVRADNARDALSKFPDTTSRAAVVMTLMPDRQRMMPP